MYEVVKRDGKHVDFAISKIAGAITKAFDATQRQYHPSVIELLALHVTSDFEDKIHNGEITVEDIQDSVEKVLSESGYADVAKAYILYRKQREKVRNINSALLNYKDLVDNYLQINSWRVKENATVSYSVGGLILSNSGAITANYWLSEVYDEEIAEAHRSAAIHLHDLSMLTGYCAGWSLKQLIQEGLGGVPGKITSSPASHLSTLCNQMVNFLGIMQNEWAGAQAFSSFDTYLAPFVRVDNLSQKEVKQCVQSFIYGVNTPSRWGTQAPFSNVTLDWTVPNDLKNLPAIVGGREQDFTYGDCQKEMDMVNKAFIEIMIEGDANGRGFQYPIPTYSITRDFDWSETENNKLLFEMTAKYGTPYFSNYINSDMEPSDVRSMCCRLRLDLRELRKKSGGFFGSGESTGSIGVVTINMPRIAYLAKDEKDFYKRLDALMDIAARSLKEGPDPPRAPEVRPGRAEPHAGAPLRLPGEVRRPVQPGGDPGGEHHLPLRQARRGGVSGDHHREHERYALLHELLPPAGGLHRGCVQRAGHPGRIADALHLRHGVPRLPGREAARLAGGGDAGAEDRGELQAALLHVVSHLFGLQGPRVSVRRAVRLPDLRAEDGGLQPHHGLLPPGAELERRQGPGVPRPEAVRHRAFRADPQRPTEGDQLRRRHRGHHGAGLLRARPGADEAGDGGSEGGGGREARRERGESRAGRTCAADEGFAHRPGVR